MSTVQCEINIFEISIYIETDTRRNTVESSGNVLYYLEECRIPIRLFGQNGKRTKTEKMTSYSYDQVNRTH